MVPAMARKGLPRSRAPEVNLRHLVDNIEVGLGTHNIMQMSIGAAPLVGGLDISAIQKCYICTRGDAPTPLDLFDKGQFNLYVGRKKAQMQQAFEHFWTWFGIY
mgnify:CR=1 FL=1